MNLGGPRKRPLSFAYWRAARAPRYSLTFACPLLLAYESLAFALSHDSLAGIRNGADVLLKSLFVGFGGRHGLIAFGLLLVGGGAALAIRDRRRAGPLLGRYFLLMAGEAIVAALAFGLTASTVTGLLLRPLLLRRLLATVLTTAQASRLGELGLGTQLMISLGAGIYEELLFRVVLVGALAWIGRRALGWSDGAAGVLATVVGALVFSAFHYVGPYGDPLTLPSFAYRAVAGVMFSGLYLLRGFGITAWTHALYDVFLLVA